MADDEIGNTMPPEMAEPLVMPAIKAMTLERIAYLRGLTYDAEVLGQDRNVLAKAVSEALDEVERLQSGLIRIREEVNYKYFNDVLAENRELKARIEAFGIADQEDPE